VDSCLSAFERPTEKTGRSFRRQGKGLESLRKVGNGTAAIERRTARSCRSFMEDLVLGSDYHEYRRPMIMGWKATRKWLLSETYQQMALLRDIAAAASEERAAAA